ncbi:hypothetical protein G3M48_007393 [Beauveria asiatica]|uniref:HNH nuclease domain-containing protein n=1 Tax=Beauveria asiatica TaxID=1069075 RepID=A0AAW0RML0_9HYPO
MAEGEGSLFVESDGPYSRAAYVETPAIPDHLTLHDNTPAVQQIRDLYVANLWDFTKWHLALFYMSSKEDLEEWIRNPEAARAYGHYAQLFGTLFTSGRISSMYRLPVDPSTNMAQIGELARHKGSHGQLPATMHSSFVPPATHKRRRLGNEIEERDREECVVTHKAKAFDGAHIVPFAVNSTRAGLDYLPPALAIAERLLGKSLGQVRRVLCTLGGSDYHWNVITLTPYLRRLWDNYGLIGFRPCYIDAEQDKSGNVNYLATFTFHWLFKNDMNSRLPIPEQLSAHDCLLMVTESGKFSTEKYRIFETVYTPGRQPPHDLQRLEDGHVCRVRFPDRKEAELMMVMLDLRWHASRLLCLSGGAGEDLLDASDDDSDSDGYLVFEESASRGVWGSDYDEDA